MMHSDIYPAQVLYVWTPTVMLNISSSSAVIPLTVARQKQVNADDLWRYDWHNSILYTTPARVVLATATAPARLHISSTDSNWAVVHLVTHFKHTAQIHQQNKAAPLCCSLKLISYFWSAFVRGLIVNISPVWTLNTLFMAGPRYKGRNSWIKLIYNPN